jgi:6-phosphogluconolactonase
MPWANTHLFWGDERYVPVDHADNNSAMATQALIEHVPIPL